MDRLTAMHVFVEVAERGSLTAAAEALDMSRAMVTRYLAEVETWLGARLLHRTTRRISLTGPGEAALLRFRQMLAIGDELQGEVASDNPEPHGLLRVTASVSFGQLHLAAAVAEFVRRHPLTRVELLLVDRVVNLVEERVDVAVRISRAIDPSLIARWLAPCRSVLCAAPSYLAERGTPTSADALAGHNCLTHHYVGKSVWQLQRHGRAISVAVGGTSVRTRRRCCWRRYVRGPVLRCCRRTRSRRCCVRVSWWRCCRSMRWRKWASTRCMRRGGSCRR